MVRMWLFWMISWLILFYSIFILGMGVVRVIFCIICVLFGRLKILVSVGVVRIWCVLFSRFVSVVVLGRLFLVFDRMLWVIFGYWFGLWFGRCFISRCSWVLNSMVVCVLFLFVLVMILVLFSFVVVIGWCFFGVGGGGWWI